ncbi:chloride channel protein [Desulfarculus baarsii]
MNPTAPEQKHPPTRPVNRLVGLLRRQTVRRILVSVLIGVVAGLGAMAFFLCLEWACWFVLGYLAGAQIPGPDGERVVHMAVTTPYRPWLLALLPVLGGLASGLLVNALAPEAEGEGTDAMIDAFHNKGGTIRGRVPFIKSAASIITLASGGSVGREGPIAQIGAGFGSWLAQTLKIPAHERRIYMLAGCAAGLGSIFRAPLGSAITSIEVLYSEDFESEAIIPCVIASVIAYCMFTFFFGFAPVFGSPHFVFHDPRELLAYAVLGLICAPIGMGYVSMFNRSREFFRGLTNVPRQYRPMLGGVGVGLVALAVPEAIGGGYGYMQLAIYGQLGLGLMCLAAGFKMVTTSLTIGSGSSGGVFGPTLFIGGMIGGVVGQVGHMLFPEIVQQPGAYVLVGMAAFFASAAKAPVGSLIMVSEMAASYQLLPPLMIVSMIAILFNRGSSIYTKQLLNKFQSPAHEADLTVNVLETLTVADVFAADRPVIGLRPDENFAQLRRHIADSHQSLFPVLDQAGALIGVLPVAAIRKVLFEDSLAHLVVVGELAEPPTALALGDDLYSALLKFLDSGHGQLPVTADGRLLGLLDHADVIAAYHQEVSRRRRAAA